VAASSAFPGLLNSMTVNTFNAPGASPVQRTEPRWLPNARVNQFENRPSFRQALVYDKFTAADKKYLHLLDGGLSDNIGLRSVYDGLMGTAGAVVPLLSLANLNTSKILVIIVNARTGDKPTKVFQPDHLPMGPLTIPAIGATSSLPMGTVSYDSVDMFTEYVTSWQQARKVPGAPRTDLYAVELTFENIGDETLVPWYQELYYQVTVAARRVMDPYTGAALYFTPHCFRHSFATALAPLIGGDAKTGAKILGHSPQTFMRYVRANDETARAAVEKMAEGLPPLGQPLSTPTGEAALRVVKSAASSGS
jgi:hypothetical protein